MSTPDSATSTAPLRPGRPRWHLIYYVLAAFDVLTVSFSLFLTHQIMGIYAQSVEVNQTWADLLRDTSRLSEQAARVNAPGNDVFASDDIEGEARKTTQALDVFQKRWDQLRDKLTDRAGEERAAPMLRDLDTIDAASRGMARDAERIFSCLREKDRAQAGKYMAEMDRRYDDVNRAFSQLREKVGDIQKEHFDEQTAAATTLQRSEYAIAALILLMVGAATIYGQKIARQVESDRQEKERYEHSLRSAHDDLERRVRERTAELLQTNEALRESEERFRHLIESTHDMIQSVRPDGSFLFVNQAWLEALGYTTDDVSSLNLFRILEPSSRAHCLELFQRVLAGESLRNIEAVFLTRDGRRIQVEGNAVGRYEGGTLVATQGFFRDITERKRAAEVRTRLLEQVMTAQEAERRRIARDLHDEIGQSLTSLMIGLRTMEGAPGLEAAHAQAGELRRIAGLTLDEVHRLARGLRPSVLDDLGLAAALERTASDFTLAHRIPVLLHASDLALGRLPEVVETALYRIVQEALTNVAKHAGARQVHITVKRESGVVQAIVEDDGRGFDYDALISSPHANTHLGLAGMKERAALLNGVVTLESGRSRGTRVCVRIPLAEEAHGEDSRSHR